MWHCDATDGSANSSTLVRMQMWQAVHACIRHVDGRCVGVQSSVASMRQSVQTTVLKGEGIAAQAAECLDAALQSLCMLYVREVGGWTDEVGSVLD
jgi:hypothetical protein